LRKKKQADRHWKNTVASSRWKKKKLPTGDGKALSQWGWEREGDEKGGRGNLKGKGIFKKKKEERDYRRIETKQLRRKIKTRENEGKCTPKERRPIRRMGYSGKEEKGGGKRNGDVFRNFR